MNKRLNMALIGAGTWGKNHARVLSQLGNTKLNVICDLNEATAKTISSQYHVEYTTNVDEALTRHDIDAVCICTPPSIHEPVAIKAIEAGKHVFVEKPMTTQAVTASMLLNETKRHGVRLMPGHIERFNPAVSTLKALIDEGKLGVTEFLRAQRIGQWSERVAAVGIIFDTTIHDVDIARFIFQDEVTEVCAHAANIKHLGLGHDSKPDYVEGVIHFSHHGIAVLHSNWLTMQKARSMVVSGSVATANLDFMAKEVLLETVEGPLKLQVTIAEPLTLELSHFADCILHDKPFIVNAEDGVRAVEVCEAMGKSGDEHRPVCLQSLPTA